MKKLALALTVVLVFFAPGLVHQAWAQGEGAAYYDEADQNLLTPDELNDLLAPIALYPDPLIAQILPAATFIDQIEDAADYVRSHGSGPSIDDQPWDLSVKAVAHYPDVLFMMERRNDWTAALGQAYIDQPQDVMDAIQRLRAEARARGNLYTTSQQQVIVTQDVIRIVPAAPEYVYVPVYDPDVIYFETYQPAFPLITFGAGLFIGAWLNRDCDWRRHRVYYHGWHGGGWVGRARPYVHDRRGVYINRRAATINVNERVLQRDTGQFREQLRNDTWRRRQGPMMRPGRPVPGTTERQRQPGAERRQPGAERQRGIEGERRRAPGEPAVGGGAGRSGAPAPARPGETSPGTPSRSISTSGQATGGQVGPSTVTPGTPAGGGQRQPGVRQRGGRSSGTEINRGRTVVSPSGPQAAPGGPIPRQATGGQVGPTTVTPGAPAGGGQHQPGVRQRGGRSGGTEINRGRTVVGPSGPQAAPGGAIPGSNTTIHRNEPRRSTSEPGLATPRPAAPGSAAPTPRAVNPYRQGHGQIQRGGSAPGSPVITTPRSPPVPRSAPITPRATAPVAVPRSTPAPMSIPRATPPVSTPRATPPMSAPRATPQMVVPRASAPVAPRATAPVAPRGAPSAPSPSFPGGTRR